MQSCDSCIYFIRIKSFKTGIGICDYDDTKLDSIIKSCPDYRPKKYKRSNKIKKELFLSYAE